MDVPVFSHLAELPWYMHVSRFNIAALLVEKSGGMGSNPVLGSLLCFSASCLHTLM